MIIIGISGKMKSGKDEVCKIIRTHFSSSVRIAFADSLKEEVAKACGVSVEFIETNKDLFRPILKWWGTDFRRQLKSNRYWLDEWLKRVKASEAQVVICPDVRFQNEASLIVDDLKCLLFRVHRPECELVCDPHPSETDLDTFKFHHIIWNDRTLDALKNEVDIALEMHGLI